MKPRVFVSAVSGEFRTTRRNTRDWLERLGYEPVDQEIFGTEAGDLRQMLREKIESCQGLLQIVGEAYGFEPPAPDEEFGRVSYTQYEFLYARSRGKKTWLLFAQEGCRRDVELEKLDLPPDGFAGDRDAWQRERRELQARYRAQFDNDGHLRYKVDSDERLQIAVQDLRSYWEELNAAFQKWQESVSRSLERIEEQLLADPDRIRAQLQRTIETTYERECEEGRTLSSWRERDAALAEAKKRREERLGSIEDFLRSITTTIAAGAASDDFLELTRVLKEEGVDEALAFVESRRPTLLADARRRLDSARSIEERAKKDLAPLFEKSRLHLTKGDYDAAVAELEDLLKLLPNWTEAASLCMNTLLQRGGINLYRRGLFAGRPDFEAARRLAKRLTSAEPENEQALYGLLRAYALLSDAAERAGNLEEARRSSKNCLAVAKRLTAADPANEQAQAGLALAYTQLGEIEVRAGNLPQARRRFESCLAIAESRGKDAAGLYGLLSPLDNLGWVALRAGDLAEARQRFETRLAIARLLVKICAFNPHLERSLVVALERCGSVALRMDCLDEARRRFEEGLAVVERAAQADPDYAEDQRTRSVLFEKLGIVALIAGDLKTARRNFENDASLRRGLAEADPDDAQAQFDLAEALVRWGDAEERDSNAESALRRYDEAQAILASLDDARRILPADRKWIALADQAVARLAAGGSNGSPIPHLPQG